MIDKADFLIVTVTEVESRAVLRVFKEATGTDSKPVSIGDRVYRNLGTIQGTRVYLAISGMGAGGVGGAQENVRKGIEALAPKAVIMVGIAFGIDEEKQAIGDILVSERLLLYDLQRAGTTKSGGFEIIPRGDRPHASPGLIDRFRMANLSWTGAKVRTGLVLTGDKLVDNLDFRDQLRALEREAIGGEMEGAGLYVACQNAKVDWILVKAICDWADGEKEKDRVGRQALAAENAVRFVVFGLGFAPFNSVKESAIDLNAFKVALNDNKIDYLNNKFSNLLKIEPENPEINLMYCILNLKKIDVGSVEGGPKFIDRIEKRLHWALSGETTRANARIIQLLIHHDYYERLSLVVNPTANQIISEMIKNKEYPDEYILEHLKFSQILQSKISFLMSCQKK